jgi:peptide/nickel transport system ATP-binding protein
MYAGRVVEEAPAATMFKRPRHPYTRGLLESLPSLAPLAPRPADGSPDKRPRLPTIQGMVPDLRERHEGCAFADRCPLVIDACREKTPELTPVKDQPETLARCIRSAET